MPPTLRQRCADGPVRSTRDQQRALQARQPRVLLRQSRVHRLRGPHEGMGHPAGRADDSDHGDTSATAASVGAYRRVPRRLVNPVTAIVLTREELLVRRKTLLAESAMTYDELHERAQAYT